MQFGGIENPGLTHLHLGQIPTQRHGFARGVARTIHPDGVAAVVAKEHGAGVGASGIGQGEAGVHGHRVLEHLQGKFQILARLAARVAFAAQVQIVRLQIFRGFDGQGFEFLRRERDAQGLGDFARNFVLHFENVLHFAVVALRPQWEIGGGVDQLRGDAQAVAGAAQATCQHVGCPQLLADL